MSSHAATDELVEFAVIHETFVGTRWREVASADSCHDLDVHVHYYARSTGQRAGEPKELMRVERLADVQKGYELAYEEIVGNWAKNRERWHHA